MALSSRGISLSPASKEWSKLAILTIESAKPQLGLPSDIYQNLARNVTLIVHNAWPMTGKRPVTGLESQFRVMRNLIDLADDAASFASSSSLTSDSILDERITFQLISSIAVMGHHPLIPGNSHFAPEERAIAEQLLPNGYAEAKWVCERMLDETLHQHPSRFRAMAVRPGQIAGNATTGYWNPLEHLSFLIKSAQTLGALPALEGDMCWTPVDQVAATLSDLLFFRGEEGEEDEDDHHSLFLPSPIYHIDNPIRQPWSHVLPLLAQELGIASDRILPFDDWVRLVRRFPGTVEDNPAARLIDFLDDNFVRMSCGGMLLETTKTQAHSPTLRGVGPVRDEVIRRYLDWWKTTGFLAQNE